MSFLYKSIELFHYCVTTELSPLLCGVGTNSLSKKQSIKQASIKRRNSLADWEQSFITACGES